MPRLTRVGLYLALGQLVLSFLLGAWTLGGPGMHAMGVPSAAMLPPMAPRIHGELALFGAMLPFVMAVAYWMLPRRAGGRRGRERLAALGLGLMHLGAVGSALGHAMPRPALVLAAKALEWLAVTAFALHVHPRIRSPERELRNLLNVNSVPGAAARGVQAGVSATPDAS